MKPLARSAVLLVAIALQLLLSVWQHRCSIDAQECQEHRMFFTDCRSATSAAVPQPAVLPPLQLLHLHRSNDTTTVSLLVRTRGIIVRCTSIHIVASLAGRSKFVSSSWCYVRSRARVVVAAADVSADQRLPSPSLCQL